MPTYLLELKNLINLNKEMLKGLEDEEYHTVNYLSKKTGRGGMDTVSNLAALGKYGIVKTMSNTEKIFHGAEMTTFLWSLDKRCYEEAKRELERQELSELAEALKI